MICVFFPADVSGGFSFGPNSIVVLTVKPSYERDQLIANVAAAPSRNKRFTASAAAANSGATSRDKRSTSPAPHKHTVSVNLRTARDSGIVYFAGTSDEYILIQVSVTVGVALRGDSGIVYFAGSSDGYILIQVSVTVGVALRGDSGIVYFAESSNGYILIQVKAILYKRSNRCDTET